MTIFILGRPLKKKGATVGMNVVSQVRMGIIDTGVDQGHDYGRIAVGIAPGRLDVDEIQRILFPPRIVRVVGKRGIVSSLRGRLIIGQERGYAQASDANGNDGRPAQKGIATKNLFYQL